MDKGNENVGRTLKLVEFSIFGGPCPFLLCQEVGPHKHPICPDCGAVRFGNLYCKRCRREQGVRIAGLEEG